MRGTVHAVQFYETDDYLLQTLADLRRGRIRRRRRRHRRRYRGPPFGASRNYQPLRRPPIVHDHPRQVSAIT